jgi:hypothetical protein
MYFVFNLYEVGIYILNNSETEQESALWVLQAMACGAVAWNSL